MSYIEQALTKELNDKFGITKELMKGGFENASESPMLEVMFKATCKSAAAVMSNQIYVSRSKVMTKAQFKSAVKQKIKAQLRSKLGGPLTVYYILIWTLRIIQWVNYAWKLWNDQNSKLSR